MVKGLEERGIEYVFQPNVFRGYAPDFYLPKYDLYLEVKDRRCHVGHRYFPVTQFYRMRIAVFLTGIKLLLLRDISELDVYLGIGH